MRTFSIILFSEAFGCEKGWRPDGIGNCLQFNRIPKTWHNAQNDCIYQNAHLVHVEDPDYNSMVSIFDYLSGWTQCRMLVGVVCRS